MDMRLAGIYLILKELGGFNIGTLEERVFVQKAIYLLQVLGLDLRFRFSWYLRGPYSKTLSQCVYEIYDDQELKDRSDKLKLKPEIDPVLTQLKGWMDKVPTGLELSQWFELLSSIHYVKHISKPSESVTEANIGDFLKKVGKKVFSAEMIGEAWRTLDSAGLISEKQINMVSSPS